MEEKMKSKFNNEFAVILKNHEDKMVLNQQTISEIGNIIKQFTSFGKEMAEITKTNLNIYFEWVLSKISELNNSSETCMFLHSENKVYCAKVIAAKIRKDGYDTKYFQTLIDEIINPLLKVWESQLESENKFPLSQQIIQSKKVYQKENVTEKVALKTIRPKSDPLSEKTNPHIIHTIPILPANFEQIQCDGSEKEILNFFMLLTTSKNRLNGQFYMSENDVKEFVEQNFSVFNKEPRGTYFDLNIFPKQKNIMMYFIYQFTVKYNRKLSVNKIKYALLLINNFEIFKNANPKILVSNMSESKRPKSKLDIIQIPRLNS